MQLLKYELYKIFKQRSLYPTCVVLLVMCSLALGYPFKSGPEKEVYKEWEGPFTEEKIQQARNESAELRHKLQLRKDDEDNVYTEKEQIRLRIYQKILLSQSIETNIAERLMDTQNEATDEINLEKRMLDDIRFTTLTYHTGPAQTVGFVEFGSIFFIGALLCLGLSPIFSKEYSSGVDHYILSSRKRKELVWAKIGASLLYTFILFATWEIFSLIVNFLKHGNEGWSTPLQLFTQHTEAPYADSPYALSLLSYHVAQLGIHLAGAIGFALLIVLISSLSKSSMTAFFVSASVFFAPIFMENVQGLRTIMTFSFISIMRVQTLFNEFKAFSLFGYPVLYPFVAVVLMMGLAFLYVSCIFQVLKRKEVTP
jgi:hypothetical protein